MVGLLLGYHGNSCQPLLVIVRRDRGETERESKREGEREEDRGGEREGELALMSEVQAGNKQWQHRVLLRVRAAQSWECSFCRG